MPRTIRKRQLRNKKSRKQRGGDYTDEQKKKIEEIQKTINDSIEKLLIELGDSELPKDTEKSNPNLRSVASKTMSYFKRNAPISPAEEVVNAANEVNIINNKQNDSSNARQ